MPRFSRKSKRRSGGENEHLVEHLLEGNCLDCLIDPATHDRQDLRQEWNRLRDTLLPAFVREHPGERPWAWWEFDSPGRRERLRGGLHPFDNKERTLAVAKSDNPNFWKSAYRLWFGLPSCFIPPFDHGTKADQFEATWEYLVRHNLLLPEDSP